MNIDTFIEIGSQHKICEDYIVSDTDPIPFIVISDGCSSSKNTEMGSMIICHLAKQYIKYRTEFPIDYNKMGLWVIHNAELVSRQLGLNPHCLNATLIVAYEYEGEINAHFYGDGCFITKGEMGLTTHIVEYTKNAPYYLAYQLDAKDHRLYDQLNVDKTITTIYGDGTNTQIIEKAYDAETTVRVTTDTDITLIASDGLQSFIKKENSKITQRFGPRDIIMPFIDFKTTKGKFLKRRMSKQVKAYTKDNILHFDDLSVGAFINA